MGGPQAPKWWIVWPAALTVEAAMLACLFVSFPNPPAPPIRTPKSMAVRLVSWPQTAARISPQPAPQKPAVSLPKSLPRPLHSPQIKVPLPHGSKAVICSPSAHDHDPFTPDRRPIVQKSTGFAQATKPALVPTAIPTSSLPATPVTSAVTHPSIPVYAHNPAPDYPQSARWEGEEGTVVLRVLVNGSGLPEKITVARSSGYTSLDRAAEKAVQRWRFTPGTRDGKAVAMQVEIPIRFRLRDAEP